MVRLTDSVVLVIINRYTQARLSLGYRTLMQLCRLSDRAIKAAIERLEQTHRIDVDRPGRGRRHAYNVIKPPTREEAILAAAHLGEPLPE